MIKYKETGGRIPLNKRVPGLFYYDLRSADDPMDGYTIERHVLINHIGTLVTDTDILGSRELMDDEEFDRLETEYDNTMVIEKEKTNE